MSIVSLTCRYSCIVLAAQVTEHLPENILQYFNYNAEKKGSLAARLGMKKTVLNL